jgi:hypothetical protein
MQRLAIPLLIAAALAGCASAPDPEANKSRPEDKFDVTRPGATYMDGALVVARMATPGKDEPFAYYDAEIENRGASPLALEFRSTWKGAKDNVLGSGDWRPLDLAPGEHKTVSDETESYPEAHFVKLEIRPRP